MKGHIYPYFGSRGRGIYVYGLKLSPYNANFEVENHDGGTVFLKHWYLHTKVHILRFKVIAAVLLNVQGLWDSNLCV
jgi:hypothetical protein